MVPVEQNQVDKGLERLPSGLQGLENLEKLLTIFLNQTQELEETNIALAGKKDVYTVEGDWLDYIGSILGVERAARDDDSYRAAILLEIAINTSDGTPDNLINLVNQFTDSSNSTYIEYHPAAFYTINTGTENENNTLWQLVQDIKPAGVYAEVVWNENGDRFLPAWINEEGETEDTEFAFLDWIEVSDFSLFTNGQTASLELSTGDILQVTTSNVDGSDDRGYLAQIINDTTTN